MTILIYVFGSLILCAGFVLLLDPEIIFGFLRKNIENIAIQVIAVMSRLMIGVLLISQSSLSMFQLEVEVVGAVLIVAGISLAAIGTRRFQKLMSRTLSKSKLYGRFTGVMSIAFGGLLIYAFYA